MQSRSLQHLFDAMHHGKYEFQDFLHGDIASGYESIQIKQRSVYRPNKKLKAYLVFLNTFVFEYFPINERVVYSYRKGVNPHEVAFPHAHNRAFFQTDIENFFGNIGRALVKSTIVLHKDKVPVSDLCSYIERILDFTTIGGVLPIGFPTSPPISNACLTPFDDEFENYCLSSGLVYTRYADDIFVSGKCREDLSAVEQNLNKLLAYHFDGSMRLNREKRKLTTIGRKTKFLGMVILPNGQVTIDMEVKKKVEVLLYFFIHRRDKFLDLSDGDLDAGIQKLSGYINYINTADGPYLGKLKRKFGVTVIDSFLHRTAQ